jgi:hypothetical protein
MLSSDKNVETIAQLAEIVKHYIGLQGEYLKLDVIDKLVRLLTATALAVVFFLLLVAVAMHFSIAFALWLAIYTGMPWAFFIVGGIHFLLLILFIIYRKSLIERPLVRFLANLLMSK